MNKNVRKYPLIILICFFAFTSIFPVPTVEAFSDQIIQRGATGDDVVELQARLQYIGFYNGTIDGVYGWSTYWAVRKYQDEFGLEVDGLVGPKMKAMLEKSTDFDYEWVHRQFYEGRKFTHYGKTPKEIQSGPEGSRIPPLEQERRARQKRGEAPKAPAPTPGEAPRAPGEAPVTPGEAPRAPGEAPVTPGEAPRAPGEAPVTPGEVPRVPGEAPVTPGEAPRAPGEAPAAPGEVPPTPAEPVPIEEEPVPKEEPVPEAEADDGPDIQEAINVPGGFSDNDIRIMSQAVFGESRGEPYIGQVAVAAVILNRIASPSFPNTATGVIFEPGAFCAVADGQIYMEPNETARRAVLDAINGQDPSGNALYFFNPATATSSWIWSRPQTKKIGKHIFSK